MCTPEDPDNAELRRAAEIGPHALRSVIRHQCMQVDDWEALYDVDFSTLDDIEGDGPEAVDQIRSYAINCMGYGPDQFGYTVFAWHAKQLKEECGWNVDGVENWPAVASNFVVRAIEDLDDDDKGEYIFETIATALRNFCPTITDDQIATCFANAI